MDESIKKPSYWISQLAVIVATILGVFLAANQGFKQAVIFDELRSDKANYYLRTSLKNELESNAQRIKTYVNEIQSGSFVITPLNLDTFVWESLKNSPQTLETPPHLLEESQLFYYNVSHILTMDTSMSNKAKKLNEIADNIINKVIPEFENDLEVLEKKLKKMNISL